MIDALYQRAHALLAEYPASLPYLVYQLGQNTSIHIEQVYCKLRYFTILPPSGDSFIRAQNQDGRQI
jgi:hypothetical protein